MQGRPSRPLSKDQRCQEVNEAQSSSWLAGARSRAPRREAQRRSASQPGGARLRRRNTFWWLRETQNNIILFLEVISITGPVYYRIIFSIAAINTLNSVPACSHFHYCSQSSEKGKLGGMSSLSQGPWLLCSLPASGTHKNLRLGHEASGNQGSTWLKCLSCSVQGWPPRHLFEALHCGLDLEDLNKYHQQTLEHSEGCFSNCGLCPQDGLQKEFNDH